MWSFCRKYLYHSPISNGSVSILFTSFVDRQMPVSNHNMSDFLKHYLGTHANYWSTTSFSAKAMANDIICFWKMDGVITIGHVSSKEAWIIITLSIKCSQNVINTLCIYLTNTTNWNWKPEVYFCILFESFKQTSATIFTFYQYSDKNTITELEFKVGSLTKKKRNFLYAH